MKNCIDLLCFARRKWKKFIRAMKLTTLILLMAVITSTAGSVYSQNTRLNLKMKDASIVDVFREIEKTSDFGFFFKNEELDLSTRISIDLKNATIEDVLRKVLSSDYSYKILERNIIVTRDEKFSSEQPAKSIKGKITDSSGAPIPGVSISVKGSTTGTISNAEGNYSLSNVPAEGTLIFTFVGMKTLEEKVAGKTTINVKMEEENIALDEVVAVGYGATKKKDLTSSITTVNSKDFNQGAHTDMMQLLQGKVPGLNITKDGSPTGATAIMLRGPSTLRTGEAQQPLYVVDGVPGGAISSMDDVVSIDILRDASATAIYGSKAANGVIIVTTKRGDEGSSRISYNAYVGVESVAKKIDMMNGDEYRAYLNANNLSVSPEDEDNVNTDWFKECTRLGITHNNNLSIGGGTNKTTYFASATYKEVEGVIKETSTKGLSFMANVKQKAFNDRLKVGFTFTSNVSDNEYIPSTNYDPASLSGFRDFLFNMITYMPTVSIKDATTGKYNENFSHPSAKNPVALLEQNDAAGRYKNIQGTAQIQFNVMKGLDYEINGTYKTSQNSGKFYYGKESSLFQGYNGYALRNSYEYNMKLLETFLSYNKTINKHEFKLLAGYSWQENVNGDGFQSANKNFISDAISYNNLGMGSGASGYVVDYGTTAIQTLRMISGYARLNYTFANKYLLQATVRRDGSSAFGKNNRWGTFPSASIGWRVLEESFMKNQHIFDNLKLRVGYGISGNTLGFDPLISKLRYATGSKFYYNASFINSITPTQNENPNLKWESTGMLNAGIDFSVLKGRISGTVEWYDKLTKDMLYSYSVPAAQYYVSSLFANVGQMENKGWEVSLTAIPVKTHDFSWNTTFNISFNHNNLKKLSNDNFHLDYIKTAGVGEHGQSGNTVQIIQEGHPIGQFYIWKYAGRNSSNVSQYYKADGSLTLNPGADDHFYEGNAQPKATGGWSNTLYYKNFSLDMLFRFVTGNKILNTTYADLTYPAEATHYNMPKWITEVPINDDRIHYSSDLYLEKGDYIRLDNVTLAYTFKLPKTLAVKNLKVYTTANNVFVITGYKGLDPEVYMGGMTPGIDNENFYPKTRTFLFGVNVDF